MAAAEAVKKLANQSLGYHLEPEVGQFIAGIADQLPFPSNLVLRGLLSPWLAEAALRVLARRDPSQAQTFRAMLHNTAAPTMLHAGEKINVIPHRAVAGIDGRLLPSIPIESFLAELRSLIGSRLQISVSEHHKGVRFSQETPLYSHLVNTLTRFDPSATVVPYMSPGFTDSSSYAKLGAVCYGFAPVRLGPELNFASMFHGHNERIPIDGYLWGQRVLLHGVATFCCESPPHGLRRFEH